MQLSQPIYFEDSLVFQGYYTGYEVFSLDTIFKHVPLTKALVVIEGKGSNPLRVEIAYGKSNNITESYLGNYNEKFYFEIVNPNNAFINVSSGAYFIKMKGYRISTK